MATQNDRISAQAKRSATQSAETADHPNSDPPPPTPLVAEGDDADADSESTLRDPIDHADIEDAVAAFKRDIVFKNMYEEEARDDTYAKWINLHDGQNVPDFE